MLARRWYGPRGDWYFANEPENTPAATVDVGNGQPRTVRAVTVVHHVVG